jgi:hypothetical protein
LKSYTFSILVISPLGPCNIGKFHFTFRPLKFLYFAIKSLALSHPSSSSGSSSAPLFSCPPPPSLGIPARQCSPLVPSHSHAPPYLLPDPIPWFPRPFPCRHAPAAACPCSAPPPEPPSWPSALRPSRTSSSLYIAALGRIEASSHPLAPISLAEALLPVPSHRRPSAPRRRPPSRPP